MAVHFILWVVIQYYSIYFVAQNFPTWLLGTLQVAPGSL